MPINNPILKLRWLSVSKHLTEQIITVYDCNGILTIKLDKKITIYLAQKTSKFRIKSFLDWAYYTPTTLAQAINTSSVEEYYEIMLDNVYSDPNVWKDYQFEIQLKSYYAARVGRCSLVS